MDNNSNRYWLALKRAPRVGDRTFTALLEKAGSPEAVFKESRQALKSLGLSETSINFIRNPDWENVDKDQRWLEHPDRHLIKLCDRYYPPLLRQIADPPPVFFVLGDPGATLLPQIAVVGSRNPSSVGKRIANDFSAALARIGLAITSGLALGIDAASHRGALIAHGKTIAVAGTGLDKVYPATHRQLAAEVSQNGALLSEFLPGTPPMARHFPRRNRIISGLSLGTLVIEAAARSGSLITARLALEQGREVFAIPGSIYNPLARGCNGLIRDGAKLVETVDDILEELNLKPSHNEASTLAPTETLKLEDEYENLLKHIAYEPVPVDTLVEETGKSPEAISSMLLVLELKGFVSSAAGGCYYRIK